MRPAIQRAGEFDNKPVIVIAVVAPDEATTTSKVISTGQDVSGLEDLI